MPALARAITLVENGDPLAYDIVADLYPDTGEAYALLDESRAAATKRNPELTTEMFADWASTARNSVNDFEPVIRPRWSEIDTLLTRGAQFGLFYRMSGSGSTVFKVTGITTRAIESKASLPALVVPPGTRSIITRTSTSVVPVELLD